MLGCWRVLIAMFARIRQFFSYVIPAILRPLRTLWIEVIGFVFLGLAALAIPRASSASSWPDSISR